VNPVAFTQKRAAFGVEPPKRWRFEKERFFWG
jgi:hypothetical protein